MLPRTPALIVVGLLAGPVSIHCQNSEVPPAPAQTPAEAEPVVGTEKLLEELRTLQVAAAQAREVEAEKSVRVLRNAARDNASALEAYKQAVRGVEFSGVKKETRQWQDWEKDNADRIRNSGFQDALRMLLEYLALSVDAKASSIEEVSPRLQAFADLILDNPDWTEPFQPTDEEGRRRGQPRPSPLMESLRQSAFVKWLRIEALLYSGKDWEDVPGNARGIYEKSLLPLWRQQRNPALLDYWASQIKRESDAAARSERDLLRLQFEKETLPRLRWLRARDLVILGRKSEAVSEMMGILRAHQDHPDFDSWVNELTALLGGG